MTNLLRFLKIPFGFNLTKKTRTGFQSAEPKLIAKTIYYKGFFGSLQRFFFDFFQFSPLLPFSTSFPPR